MSAKGDTLATTIDAARALLDTLLAGGWQDIHVVSGATEIFIARDGGRPNPMRTVAAAPPPAPGAPPASEDVITAPHVATVVDVLAVGTAVSIGDRIATLRVLDAEETLAAPSAGSVIAIHAQAGTLVEFKAPIVSLSGAPR